MISTTRSRIALLLHAAAPPTFIALAISIVLLFPPTQNSFYPRCPIHELFQLECPGCGATRALAALLHGNLADAIHFNALVTLLLPVAAAYGTVCYFRFLRRESFRWPQLRPSALYASLAVAAVFTVFRNLPHR